jgi:hypothetical protein
MIALSASGLASQSRLSGYLINGFEIRISDGAPA